MTNKIQKIREGIEKLKSNLIHGACSSQVAMETRCKEEAYNEVLAILDSMQEEPVSEDLEEVSKEWLKPQLDKSYESYGESMMMELTHFDGYAMLDAIEFGANWQKEQMMAKSIEAVVSQVPCSNEIILYNPSSVDKYYLPQEMNKLGLNKGDKVKLIIIKED